MQNAKNMRSYEAAVEYVEDLEFFGIKFGLNNITSLLAALGNPHLSFRSVHVAGTNGKGSVSAMLSAIYCAAGYKVGLYTSPHLASIRERFRINESLITEEQFQEIARQTKAVLPETVPITFFEFTTAMAFLFFAREEVDLAIVETGLGGRLDATNVICPDLGVITNISRDHEAHLGRSLTGITREKAGIIKRGSNLITGIHQPGLLNIVQVACLAHDCPIYVFGQDFRIRRANNDKFSYQGVWRKFDGLEIGLRGAHQIHNAALALAATENMNEKGRPVSEDSLRTGLKRVIWPGRQEIFRNNPPFLLDGAHNPGGIKTLCRSLAKDYVFSRLILIWGGMADKDHYGMLKEIAPMAHTIVLTKPKYRRSADPADLAMQLGFFHGAINLTSNIAEAISRAESLAEENDLICIAGSLYLIGEAREILAQGNGS
ncbi:MAG: folylpolyglutamate synthase/dihydrofolate synthase family protein [Pseudomonadota bacterium]